PQLSARDFEVYEDGVPQEVAFFSNEEVAFNVLLLMDVSPSVANSIENIQDAGLEFIRQARPQDRFMVVSFDQRLHVLTDFTNNRGTLESAVRSIRTGGGTSVYDAVYSCVTDRFRNVEGRKALILFSDGDDTTSRRAGYREAVDAVTESDVLAYSIRYPGSDFGGYGGGNPTINLPLPIPIPIPWPRRRWPSPSGQPRRGGGGNGGDFMSDVANAGGGAVYDAETIQDLSRLARQIAEELRHVYVVSYYPTNALANGGYRSIRVRIKSRSDLAVRHRRGYNAQDVRPTSH
ncbi:MAG TPA: VWA domain-containing protein, partial [Blastocatellia bacterium]|nr:VWA domain-containing protein [Blastocatellia bacterium]